MAPISARKMIVLNPEYRIQVKVTVQNAYLELPNRLGTWLVLTPSFSHKGFTTPKLGFKSSVNITPVAAVGIIFGIM